MITGEQQRESAVERRFVDANGLRFEVLVCEPAGSDERSPLALCLHGFPEVAESWLPQMPVLAAMGYRVWAVNQRGYGRSSRPGRVQDYAIERLMEDVAGLIDAAFVGVPEQARRVVLLGHDWGGIVAWCFATRRLRPLERMVIANVPHPACYVRSLRRGGQVLRSWYAVAFQIPRLPEWFLARDGARRVPEAMLKTSKTPEHFPRDLLEATRRNAAEPGAMRAMIDWYRALVRGGGLRRQMRLGWPVIAVPTLLLWGEKDAFLAKYTTDGTGDFARELRVKFLPGVSHWVFQDAAGECDAALRDFLSEESRAGS